MVRRSVSPSHDSWEAFMRMEREQLAQRAQAKMRRMIGRVLPGESEEELVDFALEDQLMAQDRYVLLRQGEKVWAKHIDDLTRPDRQARLSTRRRWRDG